MIIPKVCNSFGQVDGQKYVSAKSTDWSSGNAGWSSQRLPENHQEWVCVDLGDKYPVDTVHLYPRDDGDNTGYGFPVNFKVQVSTDSVNWLIVASQNDAPRPYNAQSFSFNSTECRFVRILADVLRPNPNDGGLYSMQLAEIMVYAAPHGATLEKMKSGDGKSQKLILHGVATSSYNDWNHYVSNPVVRPEMPYEMWMGEGNLYSPTILKKGGKFLMWYGAQNPQGHDQICLAFSDDGIKWRRYEGNPVMPAGDNNHVNDPTVVEANGRFYMYYTCAPEKEMDIIYLATSDDGIHWELNGAVISPGKLGSWDSLKVGRPSAIYEDGIFKVWFDGIEADPENPGKIRPGTGRHVGFATSSDGINFDKVSEPIYMNSGAVDVAHVGDEYVMLFESRQGTHWSVGKTETQFEHRGLLIPRSGENYDRYGHVTPMLLIENGKWTAVYYGAAEGLEKSGPADWNRNRIGVAFPQLKMEAYSLAGKKLGISCKALNEESLELNFAVPITESIRLRVLDDETVLLDNILENMQGGDIFLLKHSKTIVSQ